MAADQEPTQPDPRRSFYTYVTGIKGSGKTEYVWYQFASYPFDRLVLDVTHDVADLLDARGVPYKTIEPPIPASWPEWMRDAEVENGRLTLLYKPDMGAADAREDLDRALGLALRGGPPTFAWCDEWGEVCSSSWTGPNARRALHHGRHDNLSMSMCSPRVLDNNPLAPGQSDRAVTYRMLSRYDREKLCKDLGLELADFERDNKALGEFEHQVWHRRGEQIHVYEALPKWKRGQRPPAEVAFGP